MNKKNIIYVIFDREYYEILAKFDDEEECIREYNKHFNKKSCDWRAFNIKNILRSYYELREK